MKKIILLFTGIAFSFHIYSQEFQWAANLGSTGWDGANDIAVDAAGNVFTTGFFSDSADFDPGAGVSMVRGAGYWRDAFISKINADGTFGWAVAFAGPRTDEGFSIAVDAAGNVYVTGVFRETVDFDPGAGVFNLTATDTGHYQDIFVCKFTNNGQFRWAKSFPGGYYDEIAYSLALDASGNVYLTGQFGQTVDFDPGAGVFNLTVTNSSDLFVAKLDTSGNFVWAKQVGGVYIQTGTAITVDAGGNVLFTGWFTNTADFDPGNGVYNLTATGYRDIFLCKLNSAGNFVWAKQMPGQNNNMGEEITTDAAGNIYLTGRFTDSTDFDPGAGTYFMHPSKGAVFICRLDINGNMVWAKQIGSASMGDRSYGIAVDAASNIYTVGSYIGSSDLDPGPGVYPLPHDTGNNVFYPTLFISKLNAAGNFVFGKAIYQGWQVPGDIVVDAAGTNIWVTGLFTDTCDFDPGIPVHYLSTDSGNANIFVLKLGSATVGIAETRADNGYRLFPNPTSGMLQIDLGETVSDVNVSLLNSIGQLQQQSSFANVSKLTLNLQEQPVGLYFAKIQTGSGIKTIKVLKE